MLLVAIGPLVGFSFISAVRTYAEASGLGGTAAGVGEAFSPLIGVWAPTFSACELAAVFLLPFVAIRLVAGDRQSGALKLEMQQPMPAIARVAAKALVLMAGWIVASAAPVVAVVLWKSYGGWLYPPELLAVALGHLLNAGLTIALAAAMSAIAEHPSTAAILTLGVTVGTWILNFVAAVNGGWWERAAGYTPTAMVAEFQHGLIRLDVVLVALALVACRPRPRRDLAAHRCRGRAGGPGSRSALAAATAVAIVGRARLRRPSWDLSENRANSFSRADEAALARITAPLADRGPPGARGSAARSTSSTASSESCAACCRRLDVQYVSATSIGLFEQTSPHYGEIWYDARRPPGHEPVDDGRRRARGDLRAGRRRAAGASPRTREFRGHPLAVPPARRRVGVLRGLAGARHRRRVRHTQETHDEDTLLQAA